MSGACWGEYWRFIARQGRTLLSLKELAVDQTNQLQEGVVVVLIAWDDHS